MDEKEELVPAEIQPTYTAEHGVTVTPILVMARKRKPVPDARSVFDSLRGEGNVRS